MIHSRKKLADEEIIKAPPPRDPKLRFGYFYDRQEFVLLQCLSNFNVEL